MKITVKFSSIFKALSGIDQNKVEIPEGTTVEQLSMELSKRYANLPFESEKTFVIMVRTRYNKTHAWETDHFNGADCDTQITVTCTSWAVGSNINNVSGTPYETRNNTGEDYIWINFVWDNSGTGYQIADDATLTNSEIYIEARY